MELYNININQFGLLVWHVRKILTEMIKIDNYESLFKIQLEAPPADYGNESPPDPPPPAGSSSGTGGSDAGPSEPNRRASSNQNGDGDRINRCMSEGSGFRQNTVNPVPQEEPVVPADVQSEDPLYIPERHRSVSESSEVECLPTPRFPTPDIIDLLDSDCEDDQQGKDKSQTNEEKDPMSSLPDRFGSFVVNENAEDNSVGERRIFIPEAPKLIPKSTEEDEDMDTVVKKRGRPKKLHQKDKMPLPPAIESPSPKKGKKKKRGRPKTKYDEPQILKARVKKEAPVAAIRPFRADSPDSNISTDSNYKLEPGKIVFRGKIINAEEKPKRTTPNKGVRTYNHNKWTLTGLKRLESLVAVKEEKAVHECDECEAVFEKYRSLQFHTDRMHNKNLKAACPECGKKLSSSHAIKKHMLSHRPEEEWPHECPLCHKKFQARQ